LLCRDRRWAKRLLRGNRVGRRKGILQRAAGNTRARVIAVQMAWLWLRYQSKSELSLWYYRRVGDLKGRVRRIMIIALARKLVIALWRYVETGKVPTGAIVTA
jgi:transposase